MIKSVICAFSICLWFASHADAIDVYIVAGQSNGYRISSLRPGDAKLPNGRKIYYYGMKCTTEPEKSKFQVLTALDERAMGTSLVKGLLSQSDSDIVFIQYCRCGSGVWNQTEKGWYPGDDPQNENVFNGGLYGKFEKYIGHAKQALENDFKQTWQVKGLFWHQGENDSNGDHHLAYNKNLTNLFWRFRNLLGKELPIVIAEIRELTPNDRKINSILAEVAKGDPLIEQAKAADLEFQPDRNGTPDVHFSLNGCQELGQRMAKAYETILARSKK